jgi:phosphate transport system protein
MIRVKFHQSLDELRQRLLVMAGTVEQSIQRATEAYSTRDNGLCDLVLLSEPSINRMEREIDELALELLATEQPTAVDLRFIIAVIRINADLERVGDQAVNIANRVRDLDSIEKVEIPVDIPKLASLAANMIRNALRAFIERDTELAKEVLMMDDQVDDIDRAAFQSLGDLVSGSRECARQALNALIICRNLERIGDHATNIAEDVIFWVSGEDVRHYSKAKVTTVPAEEALS